MGKRGTKPMTVDTQIARGTYRNDRHDKRVRARSLDSIPNHPEGLDKEGQIKWYDFLTYAVEIKGYIAPTELGLIEQMCQAWQEWKKYVKIVDADGGGVILTDKGTPMLNPNYRVMESAHNRYFKIMREMGMTPTTRSGITLISDDSKKDGFNLD